MFRLCLVPILLGLLSSNCVESSNILVIIPTPSYSHQIAHAEIWNQLSLRGHQVTVLTTHIQNRPDLTNLTEIDLKSAQILMEERRNSVDLEKLSPLECMKKLFEFFNEVSDHVLLKPEVQDLIHNRYDYKFDLVIVEYLYPEFLAFGELYDAPTIMIGSMDAPKNIHDLYGNPTHPVIYPAIFLPLNGFLTFGERVLTTLFSYYYEYFRDNVIYQGRQKLVEKHFKNASLTIEEFMKEVSLSFINANPLLIGSRPLSPRTVVIGGGNHITLPKDLPIDIKDFLDSAHSGVIYFSLGSTAQAKDLDQSVIDSILSTLSELPYKVLWKFELKNLEDVPANVKLVKWTPQQDILRHPNIKLFITQAGLQSLEEAVYSKVPMVALPIYADQKHNTRRMARKGVMKVVPMAPSLDKDVFKSSILEVITNPSYKENMEKLLELTLDQPMSGMEKAIWWTEYVIRHRTMEHFKEESVDIPLYQYYLLDVFGFVFAALVLALGLVALLAMGLIKIIKILYRKFVSQSKTKTKKKIS